MTAPLPHVKVAQQLRRKLPGIPVAARWTRAFQFGAGSRIAVVRSMNVGAVDVWIAGSATLPNRVTHILKALGYEARTATATTSITLIVVRPAEAKA